MFGVNTLRWQCGLCHVSAVLCRLVAGTGALITLINTEGVRHRSKWHRRDC